MPEGILPVRRGGPVRFPTPTDPEADGMAPIRTHDAACFAHRWGEVFNDQVFATAILEREP